MLCKMLVVIEGTSYIIKYLAFKNFIKTNTYFKNHQKYYLKCKYKSILL